MFIVRNINRKIWILSCLVSLSFCICSVVYKRYLYMLQERWIMFFEYNIYPNRQYLWILVNYYDFFHMIRYIIPMIGFRWFGSCDLIHILDMIFSHHYWLIMIHYCDYHLHKVKYKTCNTILYYKKYSIFFPLSTE